MGAGRVGLDVAGACRRIGLDAVSAAAGPVCAWVTPSAAERFGARFPGFHVLRAGVPPPAGTATFVVCGGGSLLDRAKALAPQRPDPLRLVAIPSIWGSGAEVSPVVVLDAPTGGKAIAVDPSFVPDAYAYWPALGESVPAERRRHAAADVWAHALESSISPLAGAQTRGEATALLCELTRNDPQVDVARWFELSGAACRVQARASVGLAHGIAHVVEGPLRARDPDAGWGHARIVAAVLGRVLALAERDAPRWSEVAARLPLELVRERVAALGDEQDLACLRPVVAEHLQEILRDPCTRTNGFLVRRSQLATLLEGAA
jgi:alcohol dehydrogenase class IV